MSIKFKIVISIFSLITIIYGCKDKVKCNTEKNALDKKELQELSAYIAKTNPVFYNRSQEYFIDDSIVNRTKNFLENLCPDLISTAEFIEFSKVFLLNHLYNDLKCCHMGYDIKDQFGYPFNLTLEFLKSDLLIDLEDQEIFPSDALLNFSYHFDNDSSRNIKLVMSKINYEIEGLKEKGYWK